MAKASTRRVISPETGKKRATLSVQLAERAREYTRAQRALQATRTNLITKMVEARHAGMPADVVHYYLPHIDDDEFNMLAESVMARMAHADDDEDPFDDEEEKDDD